MRKRTDKTQGDFYKWFAKENPELIKKLGSKWTPGRWNPTYTYFNGDDYGWRDFLKVVPKELREYMDNAVFKFLTKEFNPEEYLKSVQGIVNRYWNKINVVKNIDEDEERKFRNLIKGVKCLSILSKHGTLRISQECLGRNLQSVRAENFDIDELPPEIPGVNNKHISGIVYTTNNECWWELRDIGLSNNNSHDMGYFYFKANEVKKIPEMKCTVQDGTFMAIPSDLMNAKLTERFSKLITDDAGKSKNKKGDLTINKIRKMSIDQLDYIVENYNLNIDVGDFDDDEELDDYREAVIENLQDEGIL